MRLRINNPDVLDDTHVDGIVHFGPNTMTVRTSTRVKPGRQDAVAAALRLHINDLFDQQRASARKTLIPYGRTDQLAC